MFRAELLNFDTYNLNVSGAKIHAFIDTSEFIDGTDLEEVSGKKSGNWVLSLLKEHLALSIAAGIVLLLGILTLATLFFFYRKGKKVKNEMKTWMTDFQIYNNYGPNVYKTVTAYAINGDTRARYYGLDIDDYIYDFANKVVVLEKIYDEARLELEYSSSMDLQEKESLQLIMLAAAKELEYISREVMSKIKYNFFKTRIKALHLNDYLSIEAAWEELGIDANSTFIDDIYCRYLVLAIMIELGAEQFTLGNNLQDLNNLLNELSARRGILQDLGPLSLHREVMDDFTYNPNFLRIKAVPMSNIKLGWNACFKGNEPFGHIEQRIYMLLLIRSRIIDLLSLENFSETVLDNKQMLENLLRLCKAMLKSLQERNSFTLEIEMEELFQEYTANNNNILTYDGFVNHCQQRSFNCESISSRVRQIIRYEIIGAIVNRKSKEINLDADMRDAADTFYSSLHNLLSNESLTERLNFDSDDRKGITALFPFPAPPCSLIIRLRLQGAERVATNQNRR